MQVKAYRIPNRTLRTKLDAAIEHDYVEQQFIQYARCHYLNIKNNQPRLSIEFYGRWCRIGENLGGLLWSFSEDQPKFGSLPP